MNEEKFIQIKNKLLKENITANAFRIFCILLAHSKNGICYPSIRKMAEEYSMSKTTVSNSIKELEEHEIILKENRTVGSGKKTSNCYYLNESFIVTKKEIIEDIKKIIDYLNEKLNSDYKSTKKTTQEKINERLAEGYILNDFIVVIDKKIEEWKGTEFEKYLCPDVLFGNKFETYLNQKIKGKDKASVPDWHKKEISMTEATPEEIAEMDKLLEEYRK